MTMQDHFTRWVAAYASPEATAEPLLKGFKVLLEISAFLIPSCQFTFVSKLVVKACKKLKIFKRKTTAYRPETMVCVRDFMSP